ncbi:MAG: cytochrome C554 [Deltaproteobacteria bacterium]|nr:cytochrome C554 [Deltaproteobacteria bacterium]
MSGRWILIVAIVGLASSWVGTDATADEYKYVGAKNCGKCHKKELMGNQLAEWKKAPHSKAYETLKSDKALEIAKERNLSASPHESDDCLKCHVTAYGAPESAFSKKPLKITDSIQCESCHGPGSGYRKKKTMSDRDKSIAAGMWEPGKDDKICAKCHNDESPTWDPAEGFDYEKGKEEIAHSIPEDVKGHYLELEKEQRAARKAAGGADNDDDDD